jgi:hypothetical protein
MLNRTFAVTPNGVSSASGVPGEWAAAKVPENHFFGGKERTARCALQSRLALSARKGCEFLGAMRSCTFLPGVK